MIHQKDLISMNNLNYPMSLRLQKKNQARILYKKWGVPKSCNLWSYKIIVFEMMI